MNYSFFAVWLLAIKVGLKLRNFLASKIKFEIILQMESLGMKKQMKGDQKLNFRSRFKAQASVHYI